MRSAASGSALDRAPRGRRFHAGGRDPVLDGQIARYKAPERVRVVDGLPVTVTGKPQKFVMHDRMVEHGYAEADPA